MGLFDVLLQVCVILHAIHVCFWILVMIEWWLLWDSYNCFGFVAINSWCCKSHFSASKWSFQSSSWCFGVYVLSPLMNIVYCLLLLHVLFKLVLLRCLFATLAITGEGWIFLNSMCILTCVAGGKTCSQMPVKCMLCVMMISWMPVFHSWVLICVWFFVGCDWEHLGLSGWLLI